jgi:chemotaxis protein methyltransferase CheR
MVTNGSKGSSDDDREIAHAGARIGASEFAALCRLIHRETGICLGDGKREMICARLGRRLRGLGLRGYREYCEYLANRDPAGVELRRMINCVTTNKTGFFREPHHFDFLCERVFPDLRARAERGAPKRLRIWSAGCSTGMEPYTIAMMIRERFGRLPDWDIRILASDIDSDVLAIAERGIYDAACLEDVPPGMHRHFDRGLADGKVRVRPELRQMIAFRRLNLVAEPWPIRTTFDCIFCRNVVIYFDRSTQQRLFARFAEHLSPDGCLFVGHSENLHTATDRFVPLGNTIYRTKTAATEEPEATSIAVGDVFASARPACVTTHLGSAVAVCLFDPEARVGGMTSFVLPDAIGGGGAAARFGAHAIELLVDAILSRGGERSQLQAKIFGGARIPHLAGDALDIGDKSARFVEDFLAAESIPIASRSVGGDAGRIVRFRTHTGKAFVKPCEGAALAEIARHEATRGAEMARVFHHLSDDRAEFFLLPLSVSGRGSQNSSSLHRTLRCLC